ncbi:male-specific sperm protein Mst84Db-like [Drosophila sulfurigaster albostrigata]|uniref:male-specific sperm protein Mst84Db-like n=1 Tax=Drosophila sulfurigaster albostrigata TaxID=89887 RepID=UPI002D21983C|nr:male-specific sperm protein Mst84Db-like [Drosophila sulfurigaster albostrigata]
MPCIFNPGYIGPNPPCCDPECTEAGNCNNPECGPCPGPRAPCGGCSPPIDPGQECAVTMPPKVVDEVANDCEACSNKAESANPSNLPPTQQ